MATEVLTETADSVVVRFTDRCEIPPDLVDVFDSLPIGVSVAPAVSMRFTDIAIPGRPPQMASVQLKGGASLLVQGDGVKPIEIAGEACVGVYRRVQGEEVLVALFPLREIVGVFCGTMSPVTTHSP